MDAIVNWMLSSDRAVEDSGQKRGGIIFAESERPDVPATVRWASVPKRQALSSCAYLCSYQAQRHEESEKETGHTLIVTSRARLDEWVHILGEHPELSVHFYTDPLSRRLECDWRSMMRYNVVVTTSDIVRTDEMKRPGLVRQAHTVCGCEQLF